MPTTLYKENEPPIQAIYSNATEVVEQGQYIFDTFWNNGRSALQNLKEIEEGKLETFSTTRIIEDANDIVKELSRMTAESNVLSTCLSAGGLL